MLSSLFSSIKSFISSTITTKTPPDSSVRPSAHAVQDMGPQTPIISYHSHEVDMQKTVQFSPPPQEMASIKPFQVSWSPPVLPITRRAIWHSDYRSLACLYVDEAYFLRFRSEAPGLETIQEDQSQTELDTPGHCLQHPEPYPESHASSYRGKTPKNCFCNDLILI